MDPPLKKNHKYPHNCRCHCLVLESINLRLSKKAAMFYFFSHLFQIIMFDLDQVDSSKLEQMIPNNGVDCKPRPIRTFYRRETTKLRAHELTLCWQYAVRKTTLEYKLQPDRCNWCTRNKIVLFWNYTASFCYSVFSFIVRECK